MYEKIHHFLSSIKKDAHTTKLVPFFGFTVYINIRGLTENVDARRHRLHGRVGVQSFNICRP